MIQDLDETLKQLLVQKASIKAESINFEMPFKDGGGAFPPPTINLFLYDLRENHELRSNERFLSRNFENGKVNGNETRAPIFIDLTYMITAWMSDASEEHKFLGLILKTLLQFPVLPKEVLQGEIAKQTRPLRAWIAQPEKTPNVWDFWGAMDGRLKAGISYVVTLAVEPFPPEAVGLVTEKVLTFELYKSSVIQS